ncbi:unnamed protein product [Diatraea saccharalis]|uniref:phytanoyl-CoA dioxygenase n=1 Tax=Diatraea saccharalis TaxID=40085 RepID=A0A9N9R8K1_9NEOP|nr:unnamed protein product [Diatraea saccharalis]
MEQKRIYDVCNNVPKGMIVVVKDWDLVIKKRTIEETVNKINFLNFDPVFSQYHEHPRLLHAVSQLIGENISLINSMVINKPPGSKWHPPHQNFKNQMFFTISDVDVVAPVSKRLSLTPMEPGDTVIFHSLTVHGSWANTSNLFRKAITAVYSSQECEYIDVKGSLQETFEIEINNELKRTHGSDLQHLVINLSL